MSGSNYKAFPSDALLERRVIEGLVNLAAEFSEALELDADCFYDQMHRRIFEACKALQTQKRAADPVVLQSQFQTDHAARAFVAELGYPSDANVPTWCESLRGLRSLRKTIETSMRVAALGYDYTGDPGAYLDQASKLFAEALSTRSTTAEFVPMGDTMSQVLADVDAARSKAPTRVLSTGFRQLNTALGGLEPGRLYIVAGRTGMGKSSLANQLALNVASGGNRVLAFNLEMMAKEVGRRMVSTITGIDGRKIKSGELDADQMAKLVRAADQLARFPLEYPKCTDVTIEELRRIARGRMRDGLRLVVLDYLQQAKTSEQLDSREQTVAAVSRGLKQMALELELPVIAVAQLNRDSEKRANARPGLADLRESGAIENDADVVILLYRDEYYNANTQEPGVAEVIVGKNRDGETGIVKMSFDKQCTRFRDRLGVVA